MTEPSLLGWAIVAIVMGAVLVIAALTGQFENRPHDDQWRR